MQVEDTFLKYEGMMATASIEATTAAMDHESEAVVVTSYRSISNLISDLFLR